MGEERPSCTVSVFAKPRARRSRVVDVKSEVLEIALAAPPVDGAANQVLERARLLVDSP